MPAFQVTLTDANTNYNLLALARAISATFLDRARHIVIQSDPDNGAAKIKVGVEPSLSDTRFGYEIAVGEGQIYPGSNTSMYHLKGLYARSDTAGAKLNIDTTP